ncbi:MAG: peptidoglycan DD-metalloendopeptidase family protein [Clostridia bacterium]|nr:peptidoglycan DD-metalloendopeptidase family protein [Clostridia bacterium]MBR5265233.1 peptidoglycan DD-metalloendopeptidase family protein [Clostridia bacterium]
MNKKQRQLFASIIAGLLAFLMFFSLFSSLFFTSSALTASQSNLNKLKDSLAKATAAKKEVQAEINGLKKEKSSVLKQIELLDNQIDAMQDEINLQAAVVAQLSDVIVETEQQIVETQAKEDEQYVKLKERVRLMYEHGDVSYLGVLLQSDGFFDFLSRYEIISQISTYEKKLFEEIKTLKQEIIDHKASLEQNKADEIAVQKELEASKAELNKQMSAKNAEMQKIENAQDAETAKLRELSKEEDRLAAEVKDMATKLAAQNKKDYVGGTFTWPCPGNTRITSKFGMRFHPVLKYNKLHTGTDVGAPKGAKIVAMNAGTVITSTYNSSYGNYVMVDHGGKVVTLYAHMSSRSVKKGDVVKKGQQLGLVGSTGYSTGPHLHFEVIKNGSYVDPMSYFK